MCFFCYVLFSRVPDYFEGEFVKGVVTKATFSSEDKNPVLAVAYKVGSDEFKFVSDRWYLSSHEKGQKVTIIYNPADPAIASIYSFIGYWITLKELSITAVVFVILFIIAVFITGKANDSSLAPENKKRKYKD